MPTPARKPSGSNHLVCHVSSSAGVKLYSLRFKSKGKSITSHDDDSEFVQQLISIVYRDIAENVNLLFHQRLADALQDNIPASEKATVAATRCSSQWILSQQIIRLTFYLNSEVMCLAL
ncbi:hypothetical protein RRG08_027594 [Elysia crispata]|uniref:Uncharacterized protein n=1 Tax=Elysia crispata TaxID=231223 RepID=A0AAE1AFF1_9GAST|nr:hypothetical protein RRG08_027594 [Elysia crispata]